MRRRLTLTAALTLLAVLAAYLAPSLGPVSPRDTRETIELQTVGAGESVDAGLIPELNDAAVRPVPLAVPAQPKPVPAEFWADAVDCGLG